jgi:hypothetical protein
LSEDLGDPLDNVIYHTDVDSGSASFLNEGDTSESENESESRDFGALATQPSP